MSYEHVKNWRQRTIHRLKEAFELKCGICSYDTSEKALEFHHLDANSKEFTISSSKIANWQTLVKEARKCVLLCSNCHREIHDPLVEIEIPKNIIRFNESFSEYQEYELRFRKKETSLCQKCGNVNPPGNNVYCSNKCKRKIDWDRIDLNELLYEKNLSYSEISRRLSVSRSSIIKQAKKLGLR